MKRTITLFLTIGMSQLTFGQAETITDNALNLSILKLKNTTWLCNQTTALEFWNGGLKNYPTSRIVSKMDGCGTQGEALIFETETAGQTSPSAKMIIRNNGNIGIGTTTPSSLLHIESSIVPTITIGNTKSNSSWGADESLGEILFHSSDGSGAGAGVRGYIKSITWGSGSIGSLIFGTHNSISLIEAMRINPNGYVGIGRTDPAYKLDIAGSTRASNYFLLTGVGADGRGIIADDGFTNIFSITRNPGNEIRFHGVGDITFFNNGSSGTEKMRIKSDGNVGIGIDDPLSKLAVNGQIRATEVKVLADIAVPDYVFEPDYDLRSLKETKAYIAENKHLPEIPSASEIEENGIDLGDMNMRLLKKIEELTLYQIELMEEMQEMKKELKALKK